MRYTNEELKRQLEGGLITHTEYLNRKAPEKHNHPVVFGRKVDGCPRCEELKAGAAPVKWSGTLRKEQEARFVRDLKAHDCKKAGCGPVCTFGEW